VPIPGQSLGQLLQTDSRRHVKCPAEMGRGVEIRQPLAAFDHGHRRRDKTRDVRQLLLGKTQLFASLPQPGGKALLQVARHILKLVFCRTLQVQPRSSRGHVNLLSLLVVQVGPVKAEPQLLSRRVFDFGMGRLLANGSPEHLSAIAGWFAQATCNHPTYYSIVTGVTESSRAGEAAGPFLLPSKIWQSAL